MSQKWTDAQRDAISALGGSILVSAAAGSGKTAVLAERCVHMVCDAADPCSMDELLVVTFTESAATEMRERIGRALRERAESGATRARHQLALLDHADISTVHAFCSRLLRQNFNLAGVDPAFRVLDEDEARLLRSDTAAELFEEHYGGKSGFESLVDHYGQGSDEWLIDRVIGGHALLCSLVDPRAWMDECRRRWREAAEEPFKKSELGRRFLGNVERELRRMEERCAWTIEKIGGMGGFPKYLEWLQGMMGTIRGWRKLGWDELRKGVMAYEPEWMPVEKGEKKELAQRLARAVSDSLKKGWITTWAALGEDEWRRAQGTTLGASENFLDLVDEFGRAYAKAREELHGLDFSDLERKALGILQDENGQPSAVARGLHRQYRHVLVDEYQDINELQDRILNLVSRECLTDPRAVGNLFTVGDVKQSIYRFRLAEPGRFLRRNELFRSKDAPGRVIDLKENFRSREPLLEAVNRTFERLMTLQAAEIEYDATQRLAAGAAFADDPQRQCFVGAPIELHVVPAKKREHHESDEGTDEPDRSEREAMVLASRIKQIVGSMHVMEEGKPRPARYSDIVILLRSLKIKADAYADILRAAGIPVHSEGGTGFFAATEVRDVMALLRVLDNQQQDIPLAAVLRSPLANLPEAEESLARIRLGGGMETPFHRAVAEYARDGTDELAARLRDFLAELKDWRERARRRPLAEVLWNVYEKTGYLAFCAGLENGRQRVANLIHLHERAGQFGSFARQGLHRFVKFLQTLSESTDWRRPAIPGEEDNVVRIMSVHRSKGLEFPIVCLADCGKRFNMEDCHGSILLDRKGGMGMKVIDLQRRIRYPSLAHAVVSADLKAQTLAEEMRLLYVAMTRAKEHLILVGTMGEERFNRVSSRWAGHVGALPAEDILGANCLLDWLAAVNGASGGETSPIFRMQWHQDVEGETASWGRKPFTQRQKDLADLKPLAESPAVSAEAAEILARFETVYGYLGYTRLAASRAVTSLVKKSPAGKSSGSAQAIALEMPRFFAEAAVASQMSAADRGTATHLVMEHIDFAAPCDEADVEKQIARMVENRLIAPAAASAVDRGGIRWFLDSPLGLEIRARAGSLLKEIPFAMAEGPGTFGEGLTSTQAMDQVMIRGRIDLLLPKEGGFAVVDYKTDRVSGEELNARAEEYRGQMEAYRGAMGKIAGEKVTDIYLVFLTARAIWRG